MSLAELEALAGYMRNSRSFSGSGTLRQFLFRFPANLDFSVCLSGDFPAGVVLI
jgi:hypothetical protein